MTFTYTVNAGKKSHDISLAENATVSDLKKAYSSQSKKTIHRLSFKNGDKRLEDDSKLLKDYGLENGSTITFKDLGAQIGYRTVFLGMSPFDRILFERTSINL